MRDDCISPPEGRRKEPNMIARIETAPLATGRAGTAMAAALLGVLFVYVTGFMPVQAMHDAAHDTRHAITAPCH